jgi:hypothetical protein
MTWTPDQSVRFALQLQSALEACVEGGVPLPITCTLCSCTSAVVVLKFLQRGAEPLTLAEREPTQEWALPVVGVFVGCDAATGEFQFRTVKFETTDGVLELLRRGSN